MKKILPLFFLLLLSCNEEPKSSPSENIESVKVEPSEIVKEEFQEILDTAGVKGAILIWDQGKYYSNNFDWANTGFLPASTFKIPNSIIALELDIMENDSTLIEWDGEPRFQKRWEQDLLFREAFHTSCVPCYREIARNVGVERMNAFVKKMNYGDLDIDTTNLDMFWLEGKSTISQFQQISFLKEFNEQGLPISKRTHEIMRRMMIIDENQNYTLRGKTGWSVQDDIDNCWFVGFIETENNVVYFATNIEPKENIPGNELYNIRKDVTEKALKIMGSIE